MSAKDVLLLSKSLESPEKRLDIEDSAKDAQQTRLHLLSEPNLVLENEDDDSKQFAYGFVSILPETRSELIRYSANSQRQRSICSTINNKNNFASNEMFSIFMLCSVSLGVGVFVLPSVLLITGVIPGILMLVCYAFMSTFTELLVLETAEELHSNSFEHLSKQALGKTGELLLATFMAISLLIGNAGHIQTVGQLLHDIVEWFFTGDYGTYEFAWQKTTVLYCIMLSLTIPWLFQRNLHGLSGVGTLSVMVVLITAISLIIVCFVKIGDNTYANAEKRADFGVSQFYSLTFWKRDFWRAAPTVAFVYTPILELFPVYVELQSKNTAKTKKAVYVSSAICCAVYVLVSLMVVTVYGTDTKSNSLYNVPPDNYWVTFCCFALVIVITLLYPVINYPMVNAIETIMDLAKCCKSKYKYEQHPLTVNNSEIECADEMDMDFEEVSIFYCVRHLNIWYEWVTYHRRELISVFFIPVVICIDIGVTDLADLFGLCGSLGLSFVCYIFPVLIYFKVLFRKQKQSTWRGIWSTIASGKSLVAMFCLLFSTIVMLYSTVVIIQNIIST